MIMVTASSAQNKGDLCPVLIREIEAAIKRFNMYPPGHPAAKTAAQAPYNTLKSMLEDSSQVVIGLIEGKLAVDGHPIAEATEEPILEEALTALNQHSISFSRGISLDDFHKFLGYFIGKTGSRAHWDSLDEHLRNKHICGIDLDEPHHELVANDQTVIDGNAMIASGKGAVPIAELLSENPELILGLLGDKESAKKGISEKYARAVDFDEVSRGIEQELGDLSDERVLQIINAGLKDHIKNAEDYDEVDVQEAFFKINEILEKRNQAELIPKIKELADELHLIDSKFIEMILDRKCTRKELAFEELEASGQALDQGAILTGSMAMVVKRLELYGDQQYMQQFLGRLIGVLNTSSGSWREIGERFAQIVDSAVESESENCLREAYRLVLENLSDYNLDAGRLAYYMQRAARLVEWLSSKDNLPLLNDMFDVISTYTSEELMTPADKRQAALDFYEEIGSNYLTGDLLKNLEKNFEALNKLAFNVLRRMQTETVALKLCEYLSYPQRSIRLFVIRILSEFKDSAPRAFQLIVSDSKLRTRPPGHVLLESEKWHKLRNIIMICGNIATTDAIEILEGVLSDPDPRIAEEMILALEKIKSEKACDMLASYLYFGDSKIRLRAAVALENIGKSEYADKLIQAFNKESEIKMQMIPIIARLGQERSLPFFKRLLLGQKDSVLKSFLGKSSDDFKVHILSALGKIPSPQTIGILDEFKSAFSKGPGSFLRSSRVLAAVEDAKKSIKAKLEHQALS